ncbi:MAG: alanine--tRNA ligase [Proteobacteria bacterium]|nr:alanine--tRNA ligase [Pseudomonadota bacterium]MBU1546814.1 alanine--tRNA ligase [Pseudomonadota bacterium]MBU2619596.1 alanine--tRNA ligase [Pseudomonadota bacterium]
MTGSDIRKRFLTYFADKGHTVVESSALVPHDDPTLLFTNAGMVQFKRVFMGEDKRDYVRAVTSQRCVRAGGKHNDLENVGYTARHHTFFEMLGNFSFGDYFKKDAIHYAWDFLTKEIGLDPQKLWVSVFDDDDEAFGLWEKVKDLPQGRIVRMGEKDNFWAMGDTGPCGPCSEIHIDQGVEAGCGRPDCKLGCDCDRFLEIWNLVFMQFNRSEDGALTPLPKPSIDTGMGLERIAAVTQGKFTNYDSDLFAGIIAAIAAAAGVKYGEDAATNTALRVIADHSRATTFLVADGVLPSNEGRGYVLRRIMRRAIRFGRSLGLKKPFLTGVTSAVIAEMGEAYPHLHGARELLAKVVHNEEVRFLETLDNGLAMLHQEMKRLQEAGEKMVAGDFIFKLYDTYGFPVDIVKDIAIEKGMLADEAGFNAAMEVQRNQSKKSWKATSLAEMGSGVRALLEAGTRSRFVGYETRHHHGVISGLVSAGGESMEQAGTGEQISLVCPETPFYAESGGQSGDRGMIIGVQGKARVENTVAVGDGLILHQAEVIEGSLSLGEGVELKVAEGKRRRTANNHTATHLLQAALREVLGEHVKQSGSLVNPDRLRFDFTHFSPLSREELVRVEKMVNEGIRANTQVSTAVLDREEAIKNGATALFGEKYEAKVRVVSVGEVSRELCGGTHVGATGEIGLFKIVSETGIAAGVRRIEAVTGPGAMERFQQVEAQLGMLAAKLKTSPEELPGKIEKILARQKELEREVSRLTADLSVNDLDSMLGNAQVIDGVKVVVAQIAMDSPKTMREVGDRVRDGLGSGIAVLGGVFEGKVSLLAMVTKDLSIRFHAGRIVKEVAAMVGGSGGGRPDMAQAGGTMADKLPEALAAVPGIITAQGAKASS